jgi:replication factor C subunit 2/4
MSDEVIMATSQSLVGQDSVWEECVNQMDTPSHIFITGPPGCGKTTLMREFLQMYARQKSRPHAYRWGYESIDECLLLGPDQDRGIQTIRGQVSMFIRQMSLGPEVFRWVIIDDVDTFPHISQQALRRPMESYSHITRFIFIGTSEDDLIPALCSRCIHIPMNTIDMMLYKGALLTSIQIVDPAPFTEEIWNWIITITGSNTSDLIRLLLLIRDIHLTLKEEITIRLVRILCSAPFYFDFIPLLTAMSNKDLTAAIRSLLIIWKRGYAYEDILESFQTINTLFGNNDFHNNILVHQFLINAWISYCKGNTSILALQNVLYKTLLHSE